MTIDPATPQAWFDAWKPTTAVRPSTITVDAHAHMLVPESAKLVAPHFRPELDQRARHSTPETLELNKVFSELSNARLTDPATRLADMDAMGIDVQLVAMGPGQYFYWADEALAVQAARMQNDRIAEVVAGNPDRFAGVGTLPLAHPEAAAAEARRVATEHGFTAVQIGSDANGVDLDDPSFSPLWSALEEHGLVIILHPWGFTEADRLSQYYLVNVIGMPLSSTLCVSRMILGGVFERHPGLKMMVVHGGGYLPFYIARTDHAFRNRPEMRRHITRLPSEYLSQLYFDVTVFEPDMVERLVAKYGADHVLLGTDYPFDMGVPDPLALVAGARLTDEEHRRIAGGNAVDLFRLKQRRG